MRPRLAGLALLSGAIVITVLPPATVLATPPNGFTGTTLAKGRFVAMDVFNRLVDPTDVLRPGNSGNAWLFFFNELLAPPNAQQPSNDGDVWLSLQKTKGFSDLYVQNNVWQPGGSTGWHSHPGHSLIIVTAGAVTNYMGHDPACTPTVYTVGMGFVDHGGDHVHTIRNEGTVEARTIAVQLIPADAERRVDAPSPGNCPF